MKKTYLIISLLLTISLSYAQHKGEYIGKYKECGQRKDFKCVEENLTKLIPLENNKKKLSEYFTVYSYVLYKQSNVSDALTKINEAISLNNKNFSAYYLRAQINEFLENTTNIESDLIKFLEIHKKQKSNLYKSEKITALSKLQRVGELEELLNNPNTTEKEKEKIQIGLISIKKNNKNYDDAIHDYKKLIEGNPNNNVFHNNLADTYLLNEQYDEGLQSVEKSIELNAQYPQAYITKAEILMKKNQIEEACIYINKALEFGILGSKLMQEFKHCQK